MPNGDLKTTHDYAVATHQMVTDLKELFDVKVENVDNKIEEHKKNHKWLWGIIVLIPSAIYTIFKLIGG
jgi:transcription initiation factor IIF auxiliary subunit